MSNAGKNRMQLKEGMSADEVGDPKLSLRHVSIMIPGEAVGRIIGQGGVFIKYLRSTEGMAKCSLRSENKSLNCQELELVGTNQAIRSVKREIEQRIDVARRELNNHARKGHSWTLTSNGQLLTPRETHRTGQKAPKLVHARHNGNHYAAKKQSKKAKREAEVLMALREKARRDGAKF